MCRSRMGAAPDLSMQELVSLFQQWQAIAAVVVLAILLSWESVRPFFRFRRETSGRGVHVVRNLFLGALNSLAITFLFVGLWIVAAEWAADAGFGIMNWITGGRQELGVLHAAGAVLLLDAWTYVWHRLNHRVPFLWRFHRVHHADREMDVSTASRFHLGEIVMSSALRVPLIALFGVYAWELVLYETAMFAVVQFHHANVNIPAGLDRALRAVIVTPYMHKVHHSKWRVETDSNYSSLFSVWDRIGRSFRMRDDPSTIEFGLDTPEGDGERFTELMKMPLLPGRGSDDRGSDNRTAEGR